MTNRTSTSIWQGIAIVAFNLAAALVLFLVIEGLFSTIAVVKEGFFEDLIEERKHTQYDEELGWINIPNLDIDDMYGSKSFITNSMSFRNREEFDREIPAGKKRIICSGDSFTLGYGVGNDDTWCELLKSIDPRLETVNLGQGGYAVDQAYLWYRRNRDALDHDLQIFAFITQDFSRMEFDTFHGYGKPFLVVEDGVLTNSNLPVPTRAYHFPRLPQVLEEVAELHSVKKIGKLFRKKQDDAAKQEVVDRTRAVVVEIFKALKAMNEAKDSTVVFVYLPTERDFMSERSKKWRDFLSAESVKHGFLFVDLMDEHRKVSPPEVASLYNGHYSEKGNAFIARVLYDQLLAIPEVAARLQQP